MKILQPRSGLALLAILSLSVGCYETGAMTVSKDEFFASEPKWQVDQLPPETKPNSMESSTNPEPQNSTTQSK